MATSVVVDLVEMPLERKEGPVAPAGDFDMGDGYGGGLDGYSLILADS